MSTTKISVTCECNVKTFACLDCEDTKEQAFSDGFDDYEVRACHCVDSESEIMSAEELADYLAGRTGFKI